MSSAQWCNRNMASTINICVCLLSILAFIKAGDARLLTTDQKCERLERGINAFLKGRTEYDTLFQLMGYMVQTDDWMMGNIARPTKLDFVNNTSDRHKLACKLADTNSREDVAKVMGIPKWKMDNWYVQWTAPILDVGSMKNLEEIVNVVVLLISWAEASHYPVMPYNINDEMTLETFTAVNKAMMKKHVRGYLIDLPFPFKVTPAVALEKLKSDKTYSELERSLLLDRGSLQAFADNVTEDPQMLSKIKYGLLGTLDLMKALDETGILAFPE